MAIVNISLPDQMKEYVEARMSEGNFSSTSEYFRDLVREDQKKRAQQRLEVLVVEGLESGQMIEVTDQYVAKKRSDLSRRIEERSRNVA